MASEQGHDHASTQRAELTSRGRFVYEDVDYWLYLSGFVTDGEQTALITSQSPI